MPNANIVDHYFFLNLRRKKLNPTFNCTYAPAHPKSHHDNTFEFFDFLIINLTEQSSPYKTKSMRAVDDFCVDVSQFLFAII